MKNSKQGIKNYRRRARRAMKRAEMKRHVSTKNSKIGAMLNVSMLPLFTCGNCSKCAEYCYAIRICNYSPNALRAWADNTMLYKADPDKYFSEIQRMIAAADGKKNAFRFFRWHVSGDIVDDRYLSGMYETAAMFPGWNFYTYTKMFSIVNPRYLERPKNLHIMYSKLNVDKIDNPHNAPEFITCLDGDDPKQFDGMHHCNGDCQECCRTFRGCPYGETTWNDEH